VGSFRNEQAVEHYVLYWHAKVLRQSWPKTKHLRRGMLRKLRVLGQLHPQIWTLQEHCHRMAELIPGRIVTPVYENGNKVDEFFVRELASSALDIDQPSEEIGSDIVRLPSIGS
jgi:hypothetical protein